MILHAAPGTLSAIPVWTSAEVWLERVLDVLSTPAGEAARREHRVAFETLIEIARADARAADTETGRNVATANETVGERVGRGAKTAQRARRVLTDLGLMVTVVEGRYLTRQERASMRGRQIRAASTRVLTHPPRDARKPRRRSNVHVPRRGKAPREVTDSEMVNKSSGGKEFPRPIALQRLGAALQTRMPWIAPDGRRHIGKILGVLENAHVPLQTSPSRLLELVAETNREANRSVIDPALQKNPIAYFAWLLGKVNPARFLPGHSIDERLRAAGLPPRSPRPTDTTRADDPIMHPTQCTPTRVAEGKTHSFERSGWCRYGCGVRDDGRILARGGNVLNTGVQHTPDELDYLFSTATEEEL